MHDIPPIIWFMRKHHPKFVSKMELGKGIPSVSYNLRHGGSVILISKGQQVGINVSKNRALISKNTIVPPLYSRRVPEVRRDNQFTPLELKILLKKAPSALIIPISINNSWKMLKYGKFPYGIGNHISFDVHNPLAFASDTVGRICLPSKAEEQSHHQV